MRFYEYKVPQLSQGNLYHLWQRQTIPSDLSLSDETLSAGLFHQHFTCITGSLLQASWPVGLRAPWTKARLDGSVPCPCDRVTGMVCSHPWARQRGRRARAESKRIILHKEAAHTILSLPFLPGTSLILPVCLPAFSLGLSACRKRGQGKTCSSLLCKGPHTTYCTPLSKVTVKEPKASLIQAKERENTQAKT